MRRDLVCFKISADKLKIARIKGLPNQQKIVDITVKDIRNLSEGDISQIIRTELKEKRIKNPNALGVISASSVMSKNIEVPSREPQEIEEIINLQSARYTPYSREEIIVDYINVGIYKNNYTKILLIIAALKVIKRNFEILQAAGLEVERLSITPESICHLYWTISKVKTEDGPISIINVNEDSTDFTISLRNKMIFMRIIIFTPQ